VANMFMSFKDADAEDEGWDVLVDIDDAIFRAERYGEPYPGVTGVGSLPQSAMPTPHEAAGLDSEYTDPTPDREEPDDGCTCSWTRMGGYEVQDITGCPEHDVFGPVEHILEGDLAQPASQTELAVRQIADVVRSVLHESVPPEERREEDYFLALSRIKDILGLEEEEGRL
jgi:hypothetical protein